MGGKRTRKDEKNNGTYKMNVRSVELVINYNKIFFPPSGRLNKHKS